jgi:hypothetical protein
MVIAGVLVPAAGLLWWTAGRSAPAPAAPEPVAKADDRTRDVRAVGADGNAVRAAMEPLLLANLHADLPDAAAIIAGIESFNPGSAVERLFAALVADPTPESVRAFLDAANAELRERRFGDEPDPEPERPDASMPNRQVQLRMLLGVEYARARGLLDAPVADKSLFELASALASDGDDDLHAAAALIVEMRLQDTADDEARWASIPPDQVVEDNSFDARSRHWLRGLLEVAMENAAREGRAADFEAFASRYIALPRGGTPDSRERDRSYRQSRAESFRNRLQAAKAGR